MRLAQWRQIVLVGNTVFEYGVALAALFLLNDYILAGNALGLGTLSLLLIRLREPDQLRPGLIAFAVFHPAVALGQLALAIEAGSFAPRGIAALVHAGFALAFWFLVWRLVVRPSPATRSLT